MQFVCSLDFPQVYHMLIYSGKNKKIASFDLCKWLKFSVMQKVKIWHTW